MNDLDDEERWELKYGGKSIKREEWCDTTGSIRKTVYKDYIGYYKGGRYHRLSGPARVWLDCHLSCPGLQLWFFEGDLINVKSQQEFEKYLKMKAFW